MDCKHKNDTQRNCTDWPRPPHESTHSTATDGALHPAEIVALLRDHVRWWLAPAVTCAVLAAAYSLVASRDWRATQALIVRPETTVSDDRLGKFSDLSEMKTLQETILELAKSQGAIESTLARLGPAKGNGVGWPSARDVEDFRQQIDMRPPGGAEFGKTEVFYLSVLDPDRVRASRALVILCDVLEKRLQVLRDQRAQGMIAELRKATELAQSDLDARTAELAAFETKIGADLVELRNLNATTGGQGEVSQELQAIDAERRANESLRRENGRLLALLTDVEKNPSQLLATPNSLLRSQPSVNQLKNALVDAQIRTSNLLGGRTEKHPFVVAARAAEAALRQQLFGEVAAAIENLKVEIAVNEDHEQALLAKWLEARARISRLSETRADYANLVAAVENHTRLVEASRKNLADARARHAAAHTASVIGRIDGVEAGIRPVGPGRSSITAAGGFGGLVLGLGFVFLCAPAVARAEVESPVTKDGSASTGERPRSESPADYRTLQASDLSPKNSPHEEFGMCTCMSLEQAIRSVEPAVPRGKV